jgi:arsenate reductase-like glutaredoxin family protein
MYSVVPNELDSTIVFSGDQQCRPKYGVTIQRFGEMTEAETVSEMLDYNSILTRPIILQDLIVTVRA